jgi:hypothetical protein
MVVKAQIGGYDVGRVFMDVGSGINLIYARTLRAMCISLENLKPTDCSFHGIVPGATNYPLGKIELDVCFGNSSNYRREKLEFEAMDWPSQYHAIMGRPAFAKFMAVPHYAYLTLKILGPKGTITVQGSDGAVMVCEINEVNDQPVGKPQEQGVMNIAASFSLSKKPRLSIQ